MENSNSNSSIGYTTQFLGVPKNIKECTAIVLYNRKEIGLEEITLFNINTIYTKLIGSDGEGGLEHVILYRDTVDDYFEYNPAINIGLSRGFDVMLYLNSARNGVVGYTAFSSVQAEMSSSVRYTVRIFLTFTSEDNTSEIEVNLVNSLSEANSSNSSNSSDGEELWKYITIEQIKDTVDIKNACPKYTNQTAVLQKNKDNCISLDSGTLTWDKSLGTETFYQYGIKDSINIDPFDIGLNNFEIGNYNNDILVYRWSGLKYSVGSLLKENYFENPIEYFKHGGAGYDEIKLSEDLQKQQDNIIIEYFAGRFCVLRHTGSNEIYLYDLELDKLINTAGSDFFIDTWSNENDVLYYPKNSSLARLRNYVPRITDMYLNTDESGIRLIRKKGDWYIMKKTTIGDAFIIYSCPSGTIWTVEGKDKVIIINNKCLLVHTNSQDLNYYSLFYADQGKENRTYKTENAINLEQNGKFDSLKMEISEKYGIIMYTGQPNLINYDEGRISIIQTKGGLNDLVMCGLRKRPMKNSENVPEIVYAYGGILFYLDENKKLQYL